MAAVFVLFGVLIGVWYFLSADETITSSPLTAKKEIEKPIEPIKENTKPNIAQTSKPERRRKEISTDEIKKKIQNSDTENIIKNNLETQKQVEEVTITESVLIAQSKIKEKPIVIEFFLPPVAKELTVAVTQTAVETNSGLKKILDAALNMKNGDSDLSSIRNAKNQLFALDFRKDKTKSN